MLLSVSGDYAFRCGIVNPCRRVSNFRLNGQNWG